MKLLFSRDCSCAIASRGENKKEVIPYDDPESYGADSSDGLKTRGRVGDEIRSAIDYSGEKGLLDIELI